MPVIRIPISPSGEPLEGNPGDVLTNVGGNTWEGLPPSGGGAVSSVFGRTGAVAAQSGDYNSTQVNNASGVAGASVTAALNTLASSIAALVTGVSSVFGRTGTVTAQSGDYTSTQVNNASGVTGSTVTDALNNLFAWLQSAITPTTLNANANDYSPTGLATAAVINVSASANVAITGLDASAFSAVTKTITFKNVGTFPIFFPLQSASSSAANRFSFQACIPRGTSLVITYNPTTARWDCVCKPAEVELAYGATTAGNSTAARFLFCFFGNAAAAAAEASIQFIPIPKRGVIYGIQGAYGVALAAASTVFTVRRSANGQGAPADTTLTVTVPATSIQAQAASEALMFTVAVGDFISVKTVTSAADATNSGPRATLYYVPDEG